MPPSRSEHGFTLVELLIAIIIAGILTAVAIVGLGGMAKTGNKSACSTLLGAAQSAATTYFANTGSYPKTSGAAPIGFDALMTATLGSPAVLSLPSNVSYSADVMSAQGWSVTISGGGSNVPNTFVAQTSDGVACS